MALSCLLLWKFHGALFLLLSWYVSQPANQIGACCGFLCHVMRRCVSLPSQMPKSSSVVLCALKLRPLEQRELRSILLTQIDCVTSLFPPPPPPPPPPLPRGHGALCRQGHWDNGSESDKKCSENLPPDPFWRTSPYLHLKTDAELNLVLFHCFSAHCVIFFSSFLSFSPPPHRHWAATRSLWLWLLVFWKEIIVYLYLFIVITFYYYLSFYYLLCIIIFIIICINYNLYKFF